ncbi:hypothetical protein C2845_PM02G09720 [Panicum miliaceum]|uniref:Uncharacterized protein n=1 Tax=Panicum miliaceum TaxID=4540 RepID=A0A3L6SGU1_PANMI|nr:hypothetical protein C2845_PM02G09720 [Panicum miliaceum]
MGFPNTLLKDLVVKARLQVRAHGKDLPYARACPQRRAVKPSSSSSPRSGSVTQASSQRTSGAELPSDSGAAGCSGRFSLEDRSERPSALRRAPHASVARTQSPS